MKSYQFFKIWKPFDKEREKTHVVVNEKRKTAKSWTLFYNRLFYKALQDDAKISKGEVGNGKQLGMANYNIYFKDNFNRLIMNITQMNLLYQQNVLN